ncbi:MAG: hypothetical protein H7A51_11400 [Akkermansiaceae bacterium]|nr:hypothetical protein [Akkermansiaceae bacterium]
MNARDNPFATDRVERLLAFRPEWSGTDWNTIDGRWKNNNHRGTLTGRHGSGKTTFIDAWKKRLTGQGDHVICFFLNRDQRDLSPGHWQQLENCADSTVILDGEEQLSWLARRRFYQLTSRTSGLLVSRHEGGKLPELLHFDPDLRILRLCIEHLAADHYQQLSPHLVDWWEQTHGNIREVLLRCYDAVGNL